MESSQRFRNARLCRCWKGDLGEHPRGLLLAQGSGMASVREYISNRLKNWRERGSERHSKQREQALEQGGSTEWKEASIAVLGEEEALRSPSRVVLESCGEGGRSSCWLEGRGGLGKMTPMLSLKECTGFHWGRGGPRDRGCKGREQQKQRSAAVTRRGRVRRSYAQDAGEVQPYPHLAFAVSAA